MNFLDLAKARYSVRKFSDKKVETDKLNLILEAARVAPTAVNYQPQRILVMNNEESLAQLKLCTPYHFNAPLVFLICYDSNVSWINSHTKEDSGRMDATIVTTHMMFEATELGLGSTFVADFNESTLRKMFQLPEYLVPVALLPVGYPSESSVPHKLHGMRKDINETVFYNTFEGITEGKLDLEQHNLLKK